MDKARFNEVLTAITKKNDECVDCSHIRLTDDQVSILITALENSAVPIKSLNVSDNAISDAGAALLAHHLKAKNIPEVYLANNQISDAGAAEFLSVFEADDGHPTTFDMHGNPCSEDMIVRLFFLAKSQSLNSSVKQALLTNCAESVSFESLSYSNLDVRLIRFIMLKVQGLASVDFSSTACGDSGIAAIGEILRDSKVRSFTARNCSIGTNGLFNFVEQSALPSHKFVEALNFSENKNLTNEVGLRLPNLVFNTNTTITSWAFESTSLSPEVRNGVTVECELNKQPAVVKNVVVALRTAAESAKEINLQWEKNMERCMDFMWCHIRESTVIERLNISNAGVDDNAMELLAKALHKNTSLRVIELANNKITAAGVNALFSQIQRGKCGVQEVNLASNDLGDECTFAIINCLRTNPNVRILNIDNNPRISAENANEIGGLVLINQSPPALRTLLPAIENDLQTLTEVDISTKETTYNDECVRMLCHALMLNTAVRKLNFANNIIGDIGAVYLAELLASNTTIQDIDLTNNSVGNRGVQKICDALYINKTLKILCLDNNVFDATGVSCFSEMLRKNHSLSRVSMQRTRVPNEIATDIQRACDINREPPEAKSIFYRLRDNDDTLEEIDLSEEKRQWPLDDMTAQTLCTEIAGRSFVKRICLRGNNIGLEGCKRLAEMMSHENCAVRQLDVSRNPIGDFGLVELAKMFPKNKVMFDLDVRETGITAAGCEFAVDMMKQNDVILCIAMDDEVSGPAVDELKRQISLNNEPLALKHVLLRLEGGEAMEEINLRHPAGRPFGDVAFRHLSEGIMNNAIIRSLNVSDNKMTRVSAPFLSEVIESCPNLAFVDVSNNEIDDRGADLIIACIERASHIRTLTVKGNPMAADKQERIAQLLTLNLGSQKLKQVLLQHSRGERLEEALDFNSKNTGYHLSDEEAQVLAQILRDVTEVRALDLGNNRIGDGGCVALAEVLRANHSMQALYLDNNVNIAVASGDALFYALKINPQLHTLELSGTQVPQQIVEDIDSLLHVNQTSVAEKVDMRATTLADVDDEVQFKSTDYYMSQEEKLEKEALEICKHTEQLLLE